MTKRTNEHSIVRRAELYITQTSPGCSRYSLVEAGTVIWSNRVVPCEAGHEGARARLAMWALRNDVTVVEAVRRHQRAHVPAEVRR